VRKRRRAVEHDAGADDLAAGLAVAHHAGRVGDRAHVGEPRAGGVERGDLLAQAVGFLGPRQVRHQADRRDRVAVREALDRRGNLGRAQAEAVHPGVDLEEDLERARKLRGFEHAQLFFLMHDDREPARRDLRQLGGLEEALEQQDPPRIALCPQLDGRIELEQRQAVGVRERGQHAEEPVAVGIRLHDGEDLRFGCLHAHRFQVAPQRSEVHLGEDRS